MSAALSGEFKGNRLGVETEMAFEDTYRMSVHAVITDSDGRVLQLKQTYGSLAWGLPGGAVDPGETVIDTVRRECREELGVEVQVGPLTGVYYHSKFNSHALIFRCSLPVDAAPSLSQEHSDVRYFPLDGLSTIQRRRIDDCLGFDGQLRAAAF